LNVAGRKVGPAEIEGVLIDHDAVNQAAAVGVPDDTTGTAVVAYVVLEPTLSRATTSERSCGRSSARTREAVPTARLLFVDAFPKTQSGRSSDARSRRFIRRGPGDLVDGEPEGARRAPRPELTARGHRIARPAVSVFYGESRRKPRASARDESDIARI